MNHDQVETRRSLFPVNNWTCPPVSSRFFPGTCNIDGRNFQKISNQKKYFEPKPRNNTGNFDFGSSEYALFSEFFSCSRVSLKIAY